MADLEEILGRLVDQVDGCVAAAVAGMDGLVIEQVPRGGADLAGVVAELTHALGGLRASLAGLDGGPLREVIVTSERRTGYARLIGDDLFCLIVLGRHGNLGKARLYSEDAERRIQGALT